VNHCGIDHSQGLLPLTNACVRGSTAPSPFSSLPGVATRVMPYRRNGGDDTRAFWKFTVRVAAVVCAVILVSLGDRGPRGRASYATGRHLVEGGGSEDHGHQTAETPSGKRRRDITCLGSKEKRKRQQRDGDIPATLTWPPLRSYPVHTLLYPDGWFVMLVPHDRRLPCSRSACSRLACRGGGEGGPT
jgi:hypothetical protein